MRRRFFLLAATLLLALSVHAQTLPRVTLALRGTPLSEALTLLVERSRLDLAYTPELVQGRFSYCVIRDALPEEALRCVLGGTGLDFYRLSNGLYVLTAEQATTQRGVLQGNVVDARTGRALPDANVILLEAGTGTSTSASGQFSFPSLRAGTYAMRVTHVGYEPFTDTVQVASATVTRRVVALAATPAPIVPVVVDGLAARTRSGTFASSATIDVALRSVDAPDLTQRLAQLPGVNIGNVTADVHIQGGAAGEHDLRLDGAPVFTPPMLLNLVGPFSPFAIGQIEVQKAGFGAEPGSNTVGIIDATQVTQPGRPLRIDAQIDALSANARLMLASPRAGRLMLAAREGLWDQYRLASSARYARDWNRRDPFLQAVLAPAPADAGDPLAPYLGLDADRATPSLDFRDVHGAYQVSLGGLTTFYASGYFGERGLRTEAIVPGFEDQAYWRTQMGQARLTTVLTSRLYAQVQARTSHYRARHAYTFADTAGTRSVADGNTITETAVETRFDFAPIPRVLIEAGLAPILTRDRVTVRTLSGRAIRHQAHAWRWASYASLRVMPIDGLQAELGFRATYVNDRGQFYPEPRAALRYDSPEGRYGQVSMRMAAGLYEQFVGQYHVSSPAPSGLVTTSRIWMAMDASVQPPRAEHYSGEIAYAPAPGWRLHFDTYYKHQFRLYAVDYAAELPEASEYVPQETFLTGGAGFAWGYGGGIERHWRSNRLSVGVERGQVERGTALYGFNYYLVPWNEPWRLNAQADVEPLPGLVLLARWESIWGRAWAFRQAYYDYLASSRQSTAALPPALRSAVQRHVNTYRLVAPVDHALPAYHRLDLGIAYSVQLGAAQVQYRLDALNVLDRQNVAERQFVGDAAHYAETGLLRAEDRFLLPFTLVWGVRLTL